MAKSNDSPRSPLASQALLAAALTGLLGAGAACDDDSQDPPVEVVAGASGAAGQGGGAGSGGMAGAGAAGAAGDAGAGGDAGAAGSAGVITSSRVDPAMTEETFKAMCDEKGGTMEIHPHCGGANSCKGFSYDSDTDVFTEHTCKGLNTCTGYSCVLP